MKENIIMYGIGGIPYVEAALLFLLFMIATKGHTSIRVLKACEEYTSFLMEKNRNSTWYHRKEIWLKKNGASFHYGKWINPTSYLALCIVMSLVGGVVFIRISVGYGVLAAIFLFFLPGWLLRYLNQRDNTRFLTEIKLVYQALELQIRAGVYVSDALTECYSAVHEERIRTALLELAGNIVMKSDIYEALEYFQEKFDNRYVDALCITLLQALESGQAVELLGDISEQIKDMETIVLAKRKSALDRRITFYQLAVLAAVLGIVLYACITHMFATAVQF